MPDTTHENLITLLDKITTLHPEERAALALLAVMYAPVARSPLAQCLQKAGIKSPLGKIMNPNEVVPLMEKLSALKLVADVGGSYCCNPALSHFLARQIQEKGLFVHYAQAVQEVIAPRDSWGSLHYRSYAHCVQDIRIALYKGNHFRVAELLSLCATSYMLEFYENHPFSLVCGEPLDCDWIREMPPTLQDMIIAFYLERSLVRMQPANEAFGLLEEFMSGREKTSMDSLEIYLAQLLLRGQIKKAAAFMAANETAPLDGLRGWLALLQGDDEGAIAHFEKGIAAIKKATGKRKVFFADISGLFYLLALIRNGLPRQLQTAAELGEWAVKQRYYPQQFVIWMLYQFADVKLGKNRNKQELIRLCNTEQSLGPVSQLFHSLISSWLTETVATPHLRAMERIRAGAEKAGYGWIAAEAIFLRARIDPDIKGHGTKAKQLFHDEGVVSISDRGDSGDS